MCQPEDGEGPIAQGGATTAVGASPPRLPALDAAAAPSGKRAAAVTGSRGIEYRPLGSAAPPGRRSAPAVCKQRRLRNATAGTATVRVAGAVTTPRRARRRTAAGPDGARTSPGMPPRRTAPPARSLSRGRGRHGRPGDSVAASASASVCGCGSQRGRGCTGRDETCHVLRRTATRRTRPMRRCVRLEHGGGARGGRGDGGGSGFAVSRRRWRDARPASGPGPGADDGTARARAQPSLPGRRAAAAAASPCRCPSAPCRPRDRSGARAPSPRRPTIAARGAHDTRTRTHAGSPPSCCRSDLAPAARVVPGTARDEPPVGRPGHRAGALPASRTCGGGARAGATATILARRRCAGREDCSWPSWRDARRGTSAPARPSRRPSAPCIIIITTTTTHHHRRHRYHRRRCR